MLYNASDVCACKALMAKLAASQVSTDTRKLVLMINCTAGIHRAIVTGLVVHCMLRKCAK